MVLFLHAHTTTSIKTFLPTKKIMIITLFSLEYMPAKQYAPGKMIPA
jgi:hypothetical protein